MENDKKYYDATIEKVTSCQSRFAYDDPDVYAIAITVKVPGIETSPEIELEVSDRMGPGNLASKTQLDLTQETLEALGFNGEVGPDDDKIAGQLVGKPCRVSMKVNSKGYENWYFVTGGRRVAVTDGADRVARIRARIAAQKAAVAPSSTSNPFA